MTACLAARVAVQKFCGAHYEYEYYYSVRVISRLMLARARQTLSKRREAPHRATMERDQMPAAAMIVI